MFNTMKTFRLQRPVRLSMAVVPVLAMVLGSAGLLQAAPAGTEASAVSTQPVVEAKAELKTESKAESKQVSLVSPKMEQWPEWIQAGGSILPWQESRIGAEVGGLRLASVLVTVGDTVKKGQVLARLNADTVETDLDAANAQLAEAEATLAQAVATLERGKRLVASGGVSKQEMTLYETQKHTAEARVVAAKAQVRRQQLRLEYTTLTAPDDGIVSASFATEGAIVQSGSELFRLIRQGRLEWRAVVKGEQLLRLVPGQEVIVKIPYGPEVKGRIRQISPTIDVTSGNGLAFVDLPAGSNLKAGLTVSGTINLGKRKVLALPASALIGQEDAPKVLAVGEGNRLEAVSVKVGEVRNGRVEIVSGLDEQARVVAKNQNALVAGDVAKTVAAAD